MAQHIHDGNQSILPDTSSVSTVGSIQVPPIEAEKDNRKKPNLKKLKKQRSNPKLFFKKCFNLPAALLVVFSISASSLYGISLLSSAVLASPDPCTGDGLQSSKVFINLTFVLQNVFVFLLFPIAGWLSDTKIGRYRMIYISIWLMWGGVGLLGFGYVLRLIQPCDGITYIFGKYIITAIGFFVLSLGAAGYFPNILVFIMDQLLEVPNTLVRSYVHWFVWALYVGFFFSDWIAVASQIHPETVDNWFIIPVLASFIVFSIILVINFFCQKVFCVMVNKENPYNIVLQVLTFAAKHKVPMNRSSLTYWEDELPGRLDLAKKKYGGPLKHEQVEDVKTLLRMLLIYISLLPFFIGYSGPINQIIPFLQHLDDSEDAQSLWFIYLADSLVTLFALPVLELIILPLFPKFEYFILKPLRWMFLGVVGITLCNISLFVIDGIAHAYFGEATVCFINWSVGEKTLHFNFRWVIIPSIFWGICDLLITTSTFTFICSQAPYNMRGMLIGLFVFMQGIFQAIGDGINIGFGEARYKFVISCGFWYWFTLCVMSITGCIVFLLSSKFYHSRIRSEVDTHHQLIEDVFERRLQISSATFHISNISLLRRQLPIFDSNHDEL